MPQSNRSSEKSDSFNGYRWTYFSSLKNDHPLRLRAQNFHNSIDWDALLRWTATLRPGTRCKLLPDVGLGHNHMVRVIEFDDRIQWLARLRMSPLFKYESKSVPGWRVMQCEYSTIQLIRKETRIPTPEVHFLELEANCSVKAPFMLMDCLRGNVGMDLDMEIPVEHESAVFAQIAAIHVCSTRLRSCVPLILVLG